MVVYGISAIPEVPKEFLHLLGVFLPVASLPSCGLVGYDVRFYSEMASKQAEKLRCELDPRGGRHYTPVNFQLLNLDCNLILISP